MVSCGKSHPRSPSLFLLKKSRHTKATRSADQLAAAVELNSAEWMHLEGRLPWVQLHEEPDVLWVFGGDTWPRNHVALARFTAASAYRRVGEILRPHLAAKVDCNWIVGPVSQPENLGKHLKAHGFSCRLHCAAMACDLERLSAPPPAPVGVAVQLVDEPPSLVPLTTERRRRRSEGRKAIARFQPRRVWHFAALADGKVVGETTLFDGSNVAGLYNVEVVKEFRSRGIGTALVHAAARQARKLGHRTAVLGATGMGQGVYSRVGFREVGKLSFWKYGKMRQLR